MARHARYFSHARRRRLSLSRRRLASARLASARSELLARKYPSVSEDVIKELEAADPTRGKSVEWLVRQIVQSNMRWPEDKTRAVTALKTWQQVSRSPRALKQYDLSPDIIKYTLHDLEDLDDKVKGISARPDSVSKIPPNTKKVYDDGVIAIIKAEDVKAACELAKGTKWCTSDENMAKSYMQDHGLHVWYRNGKKFAQSSGEQFMDLRDRQITSGDDLGKIFWEVFKDVPDGWMSKLPKDAENYLVRSHKHTDIISYLAKNSGRNEVFETYSVDRGLYGPHAWIQYAEQVIKGRWPEIEDKLLDYDNDSVGITYAENVIGGRWPELEQKIIEENDIFAMVRYASNVINGRWLEVESIIQEENPNHWWYTYLDYFPQAERE